MTRFTPDAMLTAYDEAAKSLAIESAILTGAAMELCGFQASDELLDEVEQDIADAVAHRAAQKAVEGA